MNDLTRIQVLEIQRGADSNGGYVNGRINFQFGKGSEIAVTTSVDDHPEKNSLPEVEAALVSRALQLLNHANSLDPDSLDALREKGRLPTQG
ncbi:hypothetical protein ACSSVY_001334 [Roseovarius sp. MBR-51]